MQERRGEGGLMGEDEPKDERQGRDAHHHGHEDARHLVRHPLHGRLGTLRPLDHLSTICARSVSRPTFPALITKAPEVFRVPVKTASPDPL